MPDQGPTREEIGRAEEAWYNTRKGTAYGGNLTEAARNALIAAEPLTRARHVREAVEGLSDEQLTPLLCNWHDGMVSGIPMGLEAEGRRRTLAAFRAALLDALTGEGK